jgi:hypothetical protein
MPEKFTPIAIRKERAIAKTLAKRNQVLICTTRAFK